MDTDASTSSHRKKNLGLEIWGRKCDLSVTGNNCQSLPLVVHDIYLKISNIGRLANRNYIYRKEMNCMTYFYNFKGYQPQKVNLAYHLMVSNIMLKFQTGGLKET
jgi:hypothetical protein